jgi:hypothetical protein
VRGQVKPFVFKTSIQHFFANSDWQKNGDSRSKKEVYRSIDISFQATIPGTHHAVSHSLFMNSENIIELLETNISSPRQIAVLRRKFLDEYDGLASLLIPIIHNAVKAYLNVVRAAESDSTFRIFDDAASCYLSRLFELQVHLTQKDAILGEELQRAQSHQTISQLIQYDVTRLERLEQQEDVMDMQDKACQVASKRQPSLPYTIDELKARLPVLLDIAPAISGQSIQILIHQVTDRQSAQEDVGFGKSRALLCWEINSHFSHAPAIRVSSVAFGLNSFSLARNRTFCSRRETSSRNWSGVWLDGPCCGASPATVFKQQ